MRILRLVPLLAASLLMLTGCVPPFFACSAIGYGSVAHIELDEPRPGLQLELCDGEDCTPGPPEQPAEIGATEVPAATGVFALAGNSTDGWSANLLGGQPVLGYRLMDAAGTVIGEGTVDADWVRIDGSERCGGNRTAEIRLPAA